jgi:putative transposase
MQVEDAKRLTALEAENAKLKKLLAESMLDTETLRAALRGNATATHTGKRGTRRPGQLMSTNRPRRRARPRA